MNGMKIIDQRNVVRDYGFDGHEIIIDHPDYGRILIMDGYGGESTPGGGCVRWTHGKAVLLHNNDTFAVLDASWNDDTSVYGAMINGYDDTRPVLQWPGNAIASMAEKAVE